MAVSSDLGLSAGDGKQALSTDQRRINLVGAGAIIALLVETP